MQRTYNFVIGTPWSGTTASKQPFFCAPITYMESLGYVILRYYTNLVLYQLPLVSDHSKKRDLSHDFKQSHLLILVQNQVRVQLFTGYHYQLNLNVGDNFPLTLFFRGLADGTLKKTPKKKGLTDSKCHEMIYIWWYMGHTDSCRAISVLTCSKRRLKKSCLQGWSFASISMEFFTVPHFKIIQNGDN